MSKKIPFTPFSAKKGFSPSTLALAVMMAASACAQAADLEITSDNGNAYKNYSGEFDNVTMDYTANNLSSWGRIFGVGRDPTTRAPQTATVNGSWTSSVYITPDKTKTIGAATTAGSYGGTIKILGDIDAVQKIDAPNLTIGGSNVFWVQDEGSIELGSAGTTTKVWSIAAKPDALSAKNNSTITINSTNNQIVGSMDFISDGAPELMNMSTFRAKAEAYPNGGTWSFGLGYLGKEPEALKYAEEEIFAPTRPALAKTLGQGSTIKATFDGADSYWFGDEQNGKNVLALGTVVRNSGDTMGMDDTIQDALNTAVLEGFNPERGGDLDITLKNGAQWTYFGIADHLHTAQTVNADVSFLKANKTINIDTYSIPKRISSITLEEGGVINLYDVDDPSVPSSVKAKWRELGLDTQFPEVMDVKHDYVRIGDLKGNGGIFRLDLDVDNKADSDMIFIENSSTGGTFSIEPYNLENLGNVSETNTLRFASVSKAARDKVNFTDTVNIKGEYLKDYQLLIGSEDYDPESEKNADYEDRVKPISTAQGDIQTFNPHGTEVENEDGSKSIVEDVTSLIGGKNWFIYRIVESENENVTRLNANPEAGWDYARTLDRLHHRLGEIRYSDPTEKGLWARARYERLDQHQVNLDRTMVQVGADFRNTERNRVGLAFDYNWGDADFDHVKGQNDITGYNLMFYDTWLKENGAWVDLTASIGRMKTESETVLNNGQSVTADYSQRVYKLGIEAGHKFDHKTESATYFVEPQLQLQYTRLGGKSYTMSNGFAGKLSSANSLIGRAGVRLGREWANDNGQMNNAYFVADMLHEFGHGQDSYLYAGNQTVKHRIGGTGTWFDVGVSGQWRTSERTAMHFDLLKYFGGGFGNAWMANVNFRYFY